MVAKADVGVGFLAGLAAIVIAFSTACGAPANDATTDAVESEATTVVVESDVTTVVAESSARDVSFWEDFASPGALEAERFTNLDDMASSADAVVVAKLLSASNLQTVEEPGFPEAGVSSMEFEFGIDRVLRGSVDHATERGTLLMSLPVSLDHSQRAEEWQPTGQVVMFVRHIGSYARSAGAPEDEAARYDHVYRFVSSQGLFVNVAGNTAAPLRALHAFDDHEVAEFGLPFPESLVGRRFDEFMSMVSAGGVTS